MKVFYKPLILLLILFILFNIRKFIALKYNDNIVFNYIDNNDDEAPVLDSTKFSYGKIFYQNPYEYNNYVYILIKDAKEKDYVIANNSLIGIITGTYTNYAKVKLVTNKDFVQQVLVNNCYGIYQDGLITNYDNNCSININDIVYTSNLDYQNKKIKIGYISDIIFSNNNTYKVKLNIDLNNINRLLIISRDIT